ncbi:MAG TPA: hypothetical protein VF127_06505 [Nitrospira sp.]
MHHSKWNFALSTFVLCSAVACTSPPTHEGMSRPLITPSDVQEDRSILAGEWDYEEGAVVTLILDEQGNGAYPWKGGRFETHSLSDHTWHGRWVQQENDREGGFIVQLSPDFTDGEGRWWYTRIADDLAPTQKGGSFHLTKKSSGANETAATP